MRSRGAHASCAAQRTGQHLVEYVVAALAVAVAHHAALLEQVGDALAAHHGVAGVKLQLGELAKARRVVVAHRLGVAKRLQQGVALNDFLRAQR
jgi:hypothetical protein